jgi:hypothetical protein
MEDARPYVHVFYRLVKCEGSLKTISEPPKRLMHRWV